MEEQDRENGLQFLPLAINGMTNMASGLLGNHVANQNYIMNPDPARIGIQSEPVGVPQWMHCHPTPQNYVEFLAESGYPEIQKQMFYDISAQVPGSRLAYPSHLEEYPRLHGEGNLISAHTALEHHVGVQKQNWNEERNHAFQSYSGPSDAAPKYPSESRSKRSKEKAYAADRCRRLKISHWFDALQESVPHSKEVSRAAFLDQVIDHVKNLQHQVKDLCRSRLGGESASNSLMLLEGHGHYLVKEQMLNRSMEEMMGKLVDDHPSAAAELLESRGLIVMPMMTFAEGLHEPVEMFNIQGKRLTSNVQVINK